MNKGVQTEKVIWIEYMRVAATLAVIFLHSTLPLLDRFNDNAETLKYWWIGNTFDSFVRFCVPVFVMATGALLLGRDFTVGAFLKKRFLRILIPFFFWNLFYLCYGNDLILHMSVVEFLSYFWDHFHAGLSYHFWYVNMLIGLYMIIPILSKWIKTSSETDILYFLCIWLFCSGIANTKVGYLTELFNLVYFARYIGYLVLGHYLANKEFKSRFAGIYGLLAFIAGFLITVFGTYYETRATGKFSDFYYNYTALNIVLASGGLWVFFRYFFTKPLPSILSKVFSSISSCGFGIYLIHILVLTKLSILFKINCYYVSPYIGVPVTAILTFLASWVIIAIAKKIPVLKYLVG